VIALRLLSRSHPRMELRSQYSYLLFIPSRIVHTHQAVSRRNSNGEDTKQFGTAFSQFPREL